MFKVRFPAMPSQGWILEKFALGTKNYWMAFVADTLSALFFMGWAVASRPGHPFDAVAAFGFGYFLWTLTEYIFHRWVYHHESSIFGQGHRIHHIEAKTLIAMPWAMTTITVFGLWHYFSRVLGFPLFSAILAGWLAGFVFYSLVHHSHHHWSLRLKWFRMLKAYHRIHHHFPEYNYGVTMRFWDIAFRTRYHKPESKPSTPSR